MCVCRSVTQQESEELAGLQSGPPGRVWVESEQSSSCYSSWREDGRIRHHLSRRICTCQATAPGSLMVLRYFNYCVCGLYEALAWAHQSCEPSGHASKMWSEKTRLVFWPCDISEWIQRLWKCGSSISWTLLGGHCEEVSVSWGTKSPPFNIFTPLYTNLSHYVWLYVGRKSKYLNCTFSVIPQLLDRFLCARLLAPQSSLHSLTRRDWIQNPAYRCSTL